MQTARPSFHTLSVVLGSVVTVGGLLLGAISLSHAQVNLSESDNQLSLTAIPPRLGEDNSIMLKPGEKKQVSIRVINSSPETVTIRTAAQDFIVKDDGATPEPLSVEDADNRWSLASWLTMTPTTQTIKPAQTAQINVLIEAPVNALPGGHYAMITHQPDVSGVENVENDASSAQTSGVTQRVGTLLYVIVEGDITEEAFIRDFTIPNFQEFGPVPFSFTIENQSDIHIHPQISVEIKNIFGKKVETIPVEGKNIFPLTTRDFSGEWGRIWGFGRYTADAVVVYGTQNKLALASATFWLIPIKLIIAILVVLLLLIIGGMSIRRHLIHRKQDQTKRIVELESKLHQLESEKLKKFEE